MNASSANRSDCPEVNVPIHIFFTIGLVSLAENLLVVVAILWNRNLHSPMYCFIGSLAAFNTVASVTKTWENVMIAFADVGHLRKVGYLELKLDDVVDSLLCMCFLGSIFSFLAIAVDRSDFFIFIICFVSLMNPFPFRYITIFHALRYHNIMTMQRTGAILGAIWATCAVSAVLMVRFFVSNLIMGCFVVFFIVSLVIIYFLYVYMFILSRVHARKIAALPNGSGRHQQLRRWGNGMRGILTLTIIFGAFVVCWAPFFLHLVLLMVCPMNPYCECYRSLFQLHVVLLMSHALIDPGIYAFRIPELRHTFRRMLLCLNWRFSFTHTSVNQCVFVR